MSARPITRSTPIASHSSGTHSNAESHGASAPVVALSNWKIRLTFSNPDGELPVLTNEAKRVILDHVAARSPVLGVRDEDVAVAFEIVAPDFLTAVSIAQSTCHDAFMAADLPPLPVVSFEGGTSESVKKTLACIPDLVGVSEIAEMLQVTRQRAWQFSKTKAFPAAATELKSGPIWLGSEIREWKRSEEVASDN